MTANLHIRISDTDLCFAGYEAAKPPVFTFEAYHIRPRASLLVNLREAVDCVDILQRQYDRVEVFVNGPITPVPLADFQEEDAETTYNFCFMPEGKRRVFYDTVPASNVVFLFALAESTCRVLEDTFGDVHYTSALTPLTRHFATKGLDNTRGKRMFVYTHDGVIDVLVMEDARLVMLNTYPVKTLTDVDYYVFNLARRVGVDIAEAPIFIAGTPALREPVVNELQKYASRVYAINPAAEFNRNIIATTEGIPYDFICSFMR